jgi:hypothetical protein
MGPAPGGFTQAPAPMPATAAAPQGPSFAQRYGDVDAAIASGTFDPQGSNYPGEPTRLAYAPSSPGSMTDAPMVGAAPSAMRFAQAGGTPQIPTGQGGITGGVVPGARPVQTVPITSAPAPPAARAPVAPPGLPQMSNNPIAGRIGELMAALRSRRLSPAQVQAAEKFIEHYLKSGDPTAEERHYIRSLTDPAFKEYQLEQKRAAATSVTTGPGAEAIAIEQRYKADAPMVQEANKGAADAFKALPIVQQLIDLAPLTPQGLAGQLAPAINQILAPLGINWTGGDFASLYSALARQLVPGVREPGATSNFEQQMYLQAVPALSQSAEGRQMLGKMLQSQMQRSMRIAETVRMFQGKPELYDKLREIDRQSNLTQEMRIISLNAIRQSKGYGPVGNRPIVFTEEDFAKVPPNTEFVDHLGNTRRRRPAQ